jgi:4'-phosphopantetheinyl transferase
MPRTRAEHLGPQAVHVWQAVLDGPSPSVVRLGTWLSADERARADRFRRQADQRRFIVARSTLRAILASYLGVPPAGVPFAYGAQGKPRVSEDRLRFNVSHAHELMLVAVACTREVGIDVEYVRPIAEADRIAERMFSPRERETLRCLPASERLPSFFRAWTLKEAYLKALGEGLSGPLHTVGVPLLTNSGGPVACGGWWFCAFSPRPGYQAALAVEGGECQWWLGTWKWGAQPPSACVDQA